MGQILLPGRKGELLSRLATQLTERGYATVPFAEGGEACLDRVVADGGDAIVACLPLADMGGGAFLRRLRDCDRAMPVIVVGTDDEIAGSIDALELGATEYIADPLRRCEDVLTAVGLALGSRRGDVQLRYLRDREAANVVGAESLVAHSPAMKDVMHIVRLVCSRTAASAAAAPTILITGETGTGKGLLAKYIHYNGGRRLRPLVEINCAAIPSQLLEAELFGHERGAFTDARTSRPGLIETAHGGTLFLDEIGAASPAVQAKLLTAIEEKRIRRVGGRESMLVDTQILAATHEDLRDSVRAGRFRADLYHRLNVVSIHLPPLRERGDDRYALAERFMRSMCREYGQEPRQFAAGARRYIESHPWPGNVRELRNQIERIVLLHAGPEIEAEHFDGMAPPPSHELGGLSIHLPEEGFSLYELEKEVIRRILERFSGNVSRTARYLRITRQTLIYRMKKYGLRNRTTPSYLDSPASKPPPVS